jgi:hypothetical protein
MMRDLTMIFSVLVAVFSLGFGLYKNIEANLLEDHATAQVYRALGAVQQANIPVLSKNAITSDALSRLETPPQVIDLSRSSADESDVSICTAERLARCDALGLAQPAANEACARAGAGSPECAAADLATIEIKETACITCYLPTPTP